MPEMYKIGQYYNSEHDEISDTMGGHLNHGKYPRSFYWLFASTVIFLVVAFSYVYNLQVTNGQYYSDLVEKHTKLEYSVLPPRGIIYDINGKTLVGNLPEFNVLGLGGVLLGKSENIKKIVSKLSGVLGMPSDEVQNIFDQNINKATFIIKRDIKKEQAISIESLELDGVVVQINSKRSYIDPLYFSHVLGYVSETDNTDIKSSEYYIAGDYTGKMGVEKSYDSFLRGSRSLLNLRDDQQRQFYSTKPGADLVLNINTDLQKNLYNNLENYMHKAGITNALAVAQNPNNGDIIALVSLPSFDNNIFSVADNTEAYQKLIANNSKPLFNQVISGLFSPGSTIKPFMALAVLKEKIIDPARKILSTGSISLVNPYNSSQVSIFRDWKAHGWVNIVDAIAFSSDEYFYTVGGGFNGIDGLGITKIASYLKDFFGDKVLGIDLPGEKAGFVPTPDWKFEKKHEYWYKGDTFNVSIGQGDLLLSPLWINSYTAMVANGGILYKPRIANKILDHDTGNIIKDFDQEILALGNWNKSDLETVRSGMRKAVTEGTSRIFNTLPVTSAAKTGTAEVSKGVINNALFTVFAPYEKPEIALTVIIPGGGEGSDNAAKVAYYTLLSYFSDKVIPSN